ncbi:MAG: diguanylate cyclase (GGDEF)-like protein [Nitrospinales bacterium]|jgi:diguanylate cyclase (GGDEF)-like protein
MSDLREKIIESLSSNEDGSLNIFNSIASLEKKEGEQVYNILLNVLTQLEFSPEDAKKNWKRIVEHKEKLEAKLGHAISLMTAVCYYFSDVEKNINTPAIIELKMLEETKKQSHSDGLTGLFNRRYFDEALQGEMNRVQRYNGCFSVFFIDLDNFKKLNDTYGHQAGDLTLKVVADILRNMKRTEDTACRYGGEELVLILPETEKMNALVIAERIRKKVEEAVLEFEGKIFNVTLSGGIASYPADGKEAQNLIHAADVALYQAKESGRNRIFIHDLEKRHYLRIGISEEVQVKSVAENLNPKELNAQGKNVSSSGILFESPIAFKIGSQVQIALSIKDQADSLTVNAQVARVESFDSYFDIGVAFLDMNDAGESEFSKTLLQHLGIS